MRSKPFSGGLLVALGLVLGSGAGVALGEPSAGLLIGLTVGGAGAALLALRGR